MSQLSEETDRDSHNLGLYRGRPVGAEKGYTLVGRAKEQNVYRTLGYTGRDSQEPEAWFLGRRTGCCGV